MSESEFSAADLSGRIVDRRFEVVDKLGEGGMGAIYRAKQLSVNRMVALKLLLRDRRGDPISAERFKHEAYLASVACVFWAETLWFHSSNYTLRAKPMLWSEISF